MPLGYNEVDITHGENDRSVQGIRRTKIYSRGYEKSLRKAARPMEASGYNDISFVKGKFTHAIE